MPSRRRFIAAGLAVGTTGLAGCSALPGVGGGGGGGSGGDASGDPDAEPEDDTPREVHVESGWPNPRRDPAHTGWVPDGELADPEVEWRSDPVAFNTKPTVSGATVVAGAKGLHGFDVVSGDELWSSRYGSDAWAAPVVGDVAYATTRTLEGDDQPGVVGVDAIDGGVVETYETDKHVRIPPTQSFDASYGRRFFPVRQGVRAVTPDESEGDSTGGDGGGGGGDTDDARGWRRAVFGAHATPLAYESGSVVAATEAGEVYAFSLTGGGQWRRDLDDFVKHPVVVGAQRVYVGTHEQVVALERFDGGEAWRIPRPSSVPLALDDGRLYVVHGDELVALSPRSGGELWTTSLGGRPSTALAVGSDAVYVGTRGGEIRTFGTETGEERWTVSVGDRLGPTLALTRDRLYAVAETRGNSRVVSLA